MIAERSSLFSSWQLVVVPLILMAAFALRIWGIDFGLPNTLARPDETTLVHRALAIGAGDLNPHFFRYPSLHFYVLALVYGLYFLAGRATGHFDGVEDFQYEFFAEPSTIFILGRLLTAMMGTASVALVYSIATRWRGRTAGVLSALFLAVAFLHVRDSHFLTLDVPATFYLLVACLFAWRQFDQPNTRTALLSGLFLGLATSTKYNVVLLAPMILLAVVFSSRGHQHGSSEAAGLHLGSPQLNSKGSWTLLAMTTLVAIVAFVAGSPFVLLDYSTFLADLTAEGGQFSVGRALDLGRGWTYHLHTSLVHGLGWPLLITSAARLSIPAAATHRPRPGLPRRSAHLLPGGGKWEERLFALHGPHGAAVVYHSRGLPRYNNPQAPWCRALWRTSWYRSAGGSTHGPRFLAPQLTVGMSRYTSARGPMGSATHPSWLDARPRRKHLRISPSQSFPTLAGTCQG